MGHVEEAAHGMGKIGKPGSGPFSLTGQPNAMGGREVGGLSNLMSAHRELGNPAHRAAGIYHWTPDIVDYKNPQLLKHFLSDRGKLIPARISGVSARQQRQITRAIKRARMLALLPYAVL